MIKLRLRNGWVRRTLLPSLLQRLLLLDAVNSCGLGRTVFPNRGEVKLLFPNYQMDATRVLILRQSSMLSPRKGNTSAKPRQLRPRPPPKLRLQGTGTNCSRTQVAADGNPPRRCCFRLWSPSSMMPGPSNNMMILSAAQKHEIHPQKWDRNVNFPK